MRNSKNLFWLSALLVALVIGMTVQVHATLEILKEPTNVEKAQELLILFFVMGVSNTFGVFTFLDFLNTKNK